MQMTAWKHHPFGVDYYRRMRGIRMSIGGSRSFRRAKGEPPAVFHARMQLLESLIADGPEIVDVRLTIRKEAGQPIAAEIEAFWEPVPDSGLHTPPADRPPSRRR